MRSKTILKLERGDVIKHKAFLDVAVQVTSVNRSSKGIKISGIWLNQGQLKSSIITELDDVRAIMCEFEINEKHLENWFRCLEPTAKFLREATWETIV